MGITNENDQELNQAQTTRRRMARNALAIGAIAATAALTKITPAAATAAGEHTAATAAGDKCFLKGTKIGTAEGERKVEDLAGGDLLPTLFGGMRPIQWIARYAYKKSDPIKPWARYARPVRIARSALAPNVPHADLFVTNWHALFIDDALVPAGNLINGTTITLYPADEFDELEFFHIKFETHDVIHAEGAACETLSTVSETASNFAEYYRAYGAPKMEEVFCAPLLFYGGRRGQIKSRLRSAISPWFDCREKIDVIRDRLEERGIALCERMELLS
jgi:Hint domain